MLTKPHLPIRRVGFLVCIISALGRSEGVEPSPTGPQPAVLPLNYDRPETDIHIILVKSL